ncbi:MAG TPA: GntR family transcriptional regulator [Anaerolineales bacterium]|nr:GntR family transcriptional regulator [Anaerolineales bacterium]
MKNGTNRTQRLLDTLGRMIAETKPGDRLPSEPVLAHQLGVSRATLREAMRTFETQGMIHRRQGAGTFVVHPSQVIASGLEILESIETLARRIELPVAIGELRTENRPATPEEAKVLGLEPGAGILCLTRPILVEGHPVAYLVDILLEDLLSSEELQQGFTGSVLDLLLKRGSPPLGTSRCDINAVTATTDIARAMRIQRGDVLLRFEACLYSTDGRVIDYSFSYFLPGYFRFHVVRRIDSSSMMST